MSLEYLDDFIIEWIKEHQELKIKVLHPIPVEISTGFWILPDLISFIFNSDNIWIGCIWDDEVKIGFFPYMPGDNRLSVCLNPIDPNFFEKLEEAVKWRNSL